MPAWICPTLIGDPVAVQSSWLMICGMGRSRGPLLCESLAAILVVSVAGSVVSYLDNSAWKALGLLLPSWPW